MMRGGVTMVHATGKMVWGWWVMVVGVSVGMDVQTQL